MVTPAHQTRKTMMETFIVGCSSLTLGLWGDHFAAPKGSKRANSPARPAIFLMLSRNGEELALVKSG
jgi:hypothetical protein